MRYIVALLITAFVAVECMPRPQGLGLPAVGAPTGAGGETSVQPDVAVDEDGALEVKETYNKKATEQSSDQTAQEYDHTGADGSTVSQSSEKDSTHTQTEKEEDTESKSVKVGPQGGLSVTDDKSTTWDKTEANSESGTQSYKESSGNDPDHKHTYDSSSQYKNSNQSHDRHSDQSHNQLSLTPDLQTNSQHDETSSDLHTEQQTEEGSGNEKREDYDKDDGRMTYSRSESGGAYKNEANKSTNNSTSKHEEKTNNIGEGDNINDNTNNTNDTDINTDLDVISDQNETQIASDGESDKDADTGAVSGQGETEINANGGGEMDTDTDASGGQSETEIDAKAGGEEDGNSETGIETEGPKFHVDAALYRELDRDERALGIVRDEDTSESVEQGSDTEFAKIRNDYLLAVAQNIHNARIVGDGEGNARVVTPFQHSEGGSPGDFLSVDAPYRTLAQRYGASPVSSHYANAQLIESRFGNLPSFFDSGLLGYKFKNGNNQYGKESDHYGKSQFGVRNLFDKGSKLGQGVLNLQLSPSEWEERARREMEIEDSLINSKVNSRVGKVDKIDPLVKEAILSRDLDDILKSAQTSKKTVAGEKEKNFLFPNFKQNEINTDGNVQATSSDENDLLEYSKDRNLENSGSSLDDFKDVRQVLTNQVDLVSENDDRFGTGVISENIMETAHDRSGLVNFGDVFEGRANNVVIDSFDNPRPEIITDKNSLEVTLKYGTTERSYVSAGEESDAIEPVVLNSSFDLKEDAVTKDVSVNNQEDLDSIKTQTGNESIIANDTTKPINVTETALLEDDINTELDKDTTTATDENDNVNANSTDNIAKLLSNIEKPLPKNETSTNSTPTNPNLENETLIANNSKGNVTSGKESEINTQEISNSQVTLAADKISDNSNTTETIKSLNEIDQESAIKTNVSELNMSDINGTDLSESVLAITETPILNKESFENNNNTNVSEKIDDIEERESIADFSTEKNDMVSEDITSEVVDLSKRKVEESNISTDNTSVIVDTASDDSQLELKLDSNSEDASNITMLANKPVVVKDTAIDINGNMSSISSQNTISDVDTNSTYNDDTTVAISSADTENVSDTTVTDNDNGDSERPERLFNRSILESDEQNKLENDAKITNDNNKSEIANVDETSSLPTANHETEVSDMNLNSSDAVNFVTNASVISEVTATELTKNSESDNINSTAKVVDLNLQESVSKTDSVSIDTSNATDASTLDTSTESNINVEFAIDSDTLELTTIPTTVAVNDLVIAPDNSSKADISSTDLNSTLGFDDNKTPDSITPINISDVTNIFTEETAKAEPNVSLNHSTDGTKKAGTANDTPVTEIVTKSTTIINSVDQSTEAGPVGDSNQADKLVINSDESDASVKSDQSETSKSTVESDILKPDKSEMSKVNIESDISEIDKLEASKATVESDTSETSKATVESDILETDKSESSKATVQSDISDSDKSETPKATLESDKSDTDILEMSKASVESDKLDTDKSEKAKSVEADKPKADETVKSETAVKTDNSLTPVKAEKENEESGSYTEDSTSKSDESSVSSERIFALRSLNSDYSGSGSSEK